MDVAVAEFHAVLSVHLYFGDSFHYFRLFTSLSFNFLGLAVIRLFLPPPIILYQELIAFYMEN